MLLAEIYCPSPPPPPHTVATQWSEQTTVCTLTVARCCVGQVVTSLSLRPRMTPNAIYYYCKTSLNHACQWKAEMYCSAVSIQCNNHLSHYCNGRLTMSTCHGVTKWMYEGERALPALACSVILK